MQTLKHDAYLLGLFQTEIDQKKSSIAEMRKDMALDILKDIEQNFVYKKDGDESIEYVWFINTYVGEFSVVNYLASSILDAYQTNRGCFAVPPNKDMEELLTYLSDKYDIVFDKIGSKKKLARINQDASQFNKQFVLRTKFQSSWTVYTVIRSHEISTPPIA